jgi:hypothetical protein
MQKIIAVPEFLFGIKYNHQVVKFVPIHQVDAREGHHFTNPIFVKAAASNNIYYWEKLGIPPIEAYWFNKRFIVSMGEGQTRVNSARQAQLTKGQTIYVPLVDVTCAVKILDPNEDFYGPQICHLCDKKPVWNLSKEAKKPVTPKEIDDDAFTSWS